MTLIFDFKRKIVQSALCPHVSSDMHSCLYLTILWYFCILELFSLYEHIPKMKFSFRKFSQHFLHNNALLQNGYFNPHSSIYLFWYQICAIIMGGKNRFFCFFNELRFVCLPMLRWKKYKIPKIEKITLCGAQLSKKSEMREWPPLQVKIMRKKFNPLYFSRIYFSSSFFSTSFFLYFMVSKPHLPKDAYFRCENTRVHNRWD